MSNPDNRVEQVLADRKAQYGDAWTQTAEMILPVKAAFDQMMLKCPRYVNAWWTILSKLVRLLYNPTHYDSWLDIAGYATLVCRDIEMNGTNEAKSVMSDRELMQKAGQEKPFGRLG